MPYATARLCPAPGCPVPILPGARACPAHLQAGRRQNDERRLSRSARGYDRAWYRFVDAFKRGLGLDPHAPDYLLQLDARNRCAVCRSRYSLEYDHVTPLARGGARLDPANVQALCHACHTRKTASEGLATA